MDNLIDGAGSDGFIAATSKTGGAWDLTIERLLSENITGIRG